MNDFYLPIHPMCESALHLFIQGEIDDRLFVWICSMTNSESLKWAIELAEIIIGY